MNARWKRNVFSFFSNTSVLEQSCKSLGRLLQASGPAKLNPRSPNLVRVQHDDNNKNIISTAIKQPVNSVAKGQRLKVSTFIYRHIHEHDQQQFTIRRGVLTGNDTRWHSASSGSPLPERTDFGPRSLQL